MRNRATTPLKKEKIRQSWSKYNLYNLSRVKPPSFDFRTFYQTKWTSKSITRHYHGETVSEAHWNKLFKRRLRGVVPMSPEYLARNDGSNESSGRGSGKGGLDTVDSRDETLSRRKTQPTPYMHMTYAPLERRLDTAIFRALFASSTRQARQFVVHGAVKVNGKKMQYPGYLLNPGDMFQVEAERVMFATGAPKAGVVAAKATEGEDGDDASEAAVAEAEEPAEEEVEDDKADDRTPQQVLRDLQAQAKAILASERTSLGGKKKVALRGFTKSVRSMLSRAKRADLVKTGTLEQQFEELKLQLKFAKQNKDAGRTALPSEKDAWKDLKDTEEQKTPETADKSKDATETGAADPDTIQLSDRDYAELFAAFTEAQDNPIDDSKPYATPWRPRDYMSAFAFIPRYLEVNQNICAAVYLRHPVARPGLAEVPTPFNQEVSGNAFAWYLRRR